MDKQLRDEPAKRFDTGKLRWSLLPWTALEEVVKVFEAGAKKYGDRNWEGGMSYSRVWDCLMRHVVAYQKGLRVDPESQCHTMAHVVANALFLIAYDLWGVAEAYDDIGTYEA
jgi:hypothetical protein